MRVQRAARVRQAREQGLFDLGEYHLDGVEIGAVRRQMQQHGLLRLDEDADAQALVTGEVVQDHQVARF